LKELPQKPQTPNSNLLFSRKDRKEGFISAENRPGDLSTCTLLSLYIGL